MSDLTAALDQFAAIIGEDEVIDALNDFTRAAADLAVVLEKRGLEDGVIAATIAGHLAQTMIDAMRRPGGESR